MRKGVATLFLACCLFGGRALALGGDFTLTADDGSRYSLSDSRGKVVILDFGYTFCPDICPTALANIAAALNGLGDAAKQVDALFVSLDPDRDTPEVLRGYTRFFHPQIRGLTGDAKTLDKVAKAYHVRYNFVGKGSDKYYTMDHSAQVYVIDRQGRLVQMVPHGLPPRALADILRKTLALGEPSAKAAGQSETVQ